MSDDTKDTQKQVAATTPETPLSQSTYEELRKLNEFTLHGVKFVTRSNLGPITVHSTGSSEKPEAQQEREITPLPGESIHAVLKRIRQMPRKEGESRFVNIRGGVGPISFIPVPSGTDPAADDKDDLLTPEENEEAFKVYMERRRRQAHGLPPGPVTEEHFRPKKD